MTVKKLRQLLKGLGSNMQVVMPLGEDSFVTVCAENSSVIQLALDEGEDELSEPIEVLLLVGCSCHVESEVEPVISEDQLN